MVKPMKTLEAYKLKISPFSTKRTLDVPNYTITYDSRNLKRKKELSYQILSKLIGGHTFIIEVKYSNLFLPDEERNHLLFDFLGKVKKWELKYRERKIPVVKKKFLNFFEFGDKKDKVEKLEIIAIVPWELWKNRDFYNEIPVYGVRYYISLSNQISDDILSCFFFDNLSDGKIIEEFEFVIFDCCIMGHMGINSANCTIERIRSLLR